MALKRLSQMLIPMIGKSLLYASFCIFLTVHHLTVVDAASASVAAFYATGYADSHGASLYALGLSAPLNKYISPVTYTSVGVVIERSTASASFREYNDKSNCMAVFGPNGGDTLFNVYSTIDNIGPQTTPMFAPLLQTMSIGDNTPGSVYGKHNDRTYWILPSDHAQATGLIFFLSQRPLVPIKQFLLSYTVYGISKYSGSLLPAIANVLGITGLSVISSGGQSFSTESYSSAFPSAPGVVYQLLEASYTYPSQWIQKMVGDSNFIKANTTIGTTMIFDYITLQAYRSTASSTTVLPPSNMITASPVPGILAREYQAAVDFATQASSTISTVTTNVEKNFIMAGWAASWAVMQALNKYSGTTLGAKASLYNTLASAQSMFLVSDLFFGTTGGSVKSSAQSQGAIASCRWAGNNVWFHTLVKTGSTYDSKPVLGALYQYALGACANLGGNPSSAQLSLPRTIHVVGFSPSDNGMVSSTCSQTVSAIETVANTSLFWHHSSHAYRGYCLPTSMSSASSDWRTHQKTYVTTSLMGVIPDAIVTSPPSTLILDFMPQTTQLHVSKANLVYLFPTLEQELYVLASYLSGVVTSTSVVCAVVSSSTYSDDITTLLKKTLTTFGITPSSGNVNQPTGALSSSISAPCTHTFVIGAASMDAAGILGVMQQQSSSIVLMSFEDLTKQYAAFASAFGSAATTVTDRLVFATNLPMWTGGTMSSGTLSGASALSTVGEFVETFSPAAQTPATARAFIVAMLYDQLTIGTSWGQPDMQAALYGNVTVHVGGMTFGPFLQSWGAQGLRNFGARDISVWSYSRVLNPSQPVLSQPMSPTLDYGSSSASSAVAPSEASVMESDCYDLRAMSSDLVHGTTTTPTGSEFSAANLSSAMSASFVGSTSSRTSALQTVVNVLLAMIGPVVLYIVILLLLHFGIAQRMWKSVRKFSCWKYCGLLSSNWIIQSSSLRSKARSQSEGDRKLESEVRSISPPSDSSGMTVVFMEIEQWRPLWVRDAEVMGRAMRHCQRSIRQALLKHNAYEMQYVEGMWLIVCSSVDVGVKLARDMAKGVAGLPRVDASVVDAMYSGLGCGDKAVSGLRLRIAVHTGDAIKDSRPSGRPTFSGGAVDGVVSAAYAAGAAGLIVLTGSANTALMNSGCRSNDTVCVETHPLKGETLFALPVFDRVGSDCEVNGAQNNDIDSKATLHFLSVASTTQNGLYPFCSALLQVHYADVCEEVRVAELRFIADIFTIPETNDSAHSDYQTLLHGVSQQVALMMECRHGISRAMIHRPPILVTQTGTGARELQVATGIQAGNNAFEVTGPSQGAKRSVTPRRMRRSERRSLCNFCYASWGTTEQE